MPMDIGSVRFAPPRWAVAAALLAVVALCALGHWQIERAHAKQRLLAAQASARATGPQPLPR